MTVTPNQMTIEVGETKQLSATVLPVDANQSVTWFTSNSKIAIVSTGGLVNIISSGSVTITAKSAVDSSVQASCQFKCVDHYTGQLGMNLDLSNGITSITLSPSQLSLAVGATSTLAKTITPSNANPWVMWTSSDESVATVDDNGTVTAVGAGKAVIMAVSEENSSVMGKCTLTVTP